MKIFQIQNNKYTTSFQAKRNDYITKNMLEPRIKEAKKIIVDKDKQILSAAAAIGLSEVGINEILKEKGITYFQIDDNTVHAASGYNGGFFSVKTESKLAPEYLKAYFAQSLISDSDITLGGLLNYKAMIEDIKRQDIVQKGLQLHTYEMNTEIEKEQADKIAKYISKLAHKYVKVRDLFFIGTDAYYYDKLEKIAYSVDANVKSMEKAEATYRECRFNTDEKGNAIGYSVKAMDLFQRMHAESSYKEQQSAEYNLPSVASSENNKKYAESFRFGNTKTYNYNIKNAIPAVLNHLSKRVGVVNPNESQLQVTRFYDDKENIITRICYYDPTIGRSLVYNSEGKYLYQMEYSKDHTGSIVACSKY